MHDIGKIGIPDSVLLKEGPLTREEIEVMKSHPRIGYDILKGSPSKYLSMGAIIALGHHEKYDGSGYPNGLHGEDIPLVARVVAVADVFDALVSERPYKHAWTLEEGIDFLKCQRGKHFDPRASTPFSPTGSGSRRSSTSSATRWVDRNDRRRGRGTSVPRPFCSVHNTAGTVQQPQEQPMPKGYWMGHVDVRKIRNDTKPTWRPMQRRLRSMVPAYPAVPRLPRVRATPPQCGDRVFPPIRLRSIAGSRPNTRRRSSCGYRFRPSTSLSLRDMKARSRLDDRIVLASRSRFGVVARRTRYFP